MATPPKSAIEMQHATLKESTYRAKNAGLVMKSMAAVHVTDVVIFCWGRVGRGGNLVTEVRKICVVAESKVLSVSGRYDYAKEEREGLTK